MATKYKRNKTSNAKRMTEEKAEPEHVEDTTKDMAREIISYAQQNITRSNAVKTINAELSNKKLSNEVELGIFEYCLTYVLIGNLTKEFIKPIYKFKVYDITRNLQHNKELVSDLKSKNIEGRMLAYMKSSQLNPNVWKTLLDKKQLEEERANNLPTTDMYRCRKCEKRKCTISLLQTRSIDEPMTIFVRCCNCYNTWTI